jgi:uncharacterized OB-fold protein
VLSAYTVDRRSTEPSPPFIGFIELDEGVSLLTRLVDLDPETLSIGDRFKAVFNPDSEHPEFPDL